MRYKYSHWDVVAAICIIFGAVISVLVYSREGSLLDLVAQNFLFIVTYLTTRSVDLFRLTTEPEKYGMATTIGGAMTVAFLIMSVFINGRSLWGYTLGGGEILVLMGCLFVFIGVMFRVTPPDRIALGYTLIKVPDRPEAKREYFRGVGATFIVSGLVPVPFALLPSTPVWFLAAVFSFIVCLVAGAIMTMVRVKKRYPS